MNDGKQDGGRKRYDEAFKRSEVALWQRGGKSASRVGGRSVGDCRGMAY